MSELSRFDQRLCATLLIAACVLVLPAELAGQVAVHRMTLDGHTGTVWSVAFNPSGTIVASGGSQLPSGVSDASVRLWNLPSGKSLGKFELPRSSTRFVLFNPAGDSLAAAGNLGLLKLCDGGDPKKTRDF